MFAVSGKKFPVGGDSTNVYARFEGILENVRVCIFWFRLRRVRY